MRRVLALHRRGAPSPPPAAATTVGTTSLTLVTYELVPRGRHVAQRRAGARSREDTGIAVEVVAGDTGTMLTKAVLTAGNPEGDVICGVDNTPVRGLSTDVFAPYSRGLADVPDEYADLVPNGRGHPGRLRRRVRQLRHAWFASTASTRPRPRRRSPSRSTRDLLVVEEPGDSSPGLAFLLATIAATARTAGAVLGSSSGQRRQGRRRLGAAYNERFSGPARILSPSSSATARAHRPRSSTPTRRPRRRRGVVATMCFRQVEYAGVLRGTERSDAARQLVDFLRRGVPGRGAVEPVRLPGQRRRRAAPGVHSQARVPADPVTVDPATIAANREGGSSSGPRSCCADPIGVKGPSGVGARPPDRRHTRDDRHVGGRALAAVPVVFLAVFYVWPFAPLLARGLTAGAAARPRASTWEIAWFTCGRRWSAPC